MNVPAAIRELEKIEMIKQADGVYRSDHAVIATQKTILKAFGIDVNYIKRKTKEISDWLNPKVNPEMKFSSIGHMIDYDMLKACHNKMDGSKAVGIDGITKAGAYDVPVKGKDKEWLEGSENVYEFIICDICPVTGDYEAGEPTWGFLYPSFVNRCEDRDHIAIYNIDPHNEDIGFLNMMGLLE